MQSLIIFDVKKRTFKNWIDSTNNSSGKEKQTDKITSKTLCFVSVEQNWNTNCFNRMVCACKSTSLIMYLSCIHSCSQFSSSYDLRVNQNQCIRIESVWILFNCMVWCQNFSTHSHKYLSYLYPTVCLWIVFYFLLFYRALSVLFGDFSASPHVFFSLHLLYIPISFLIFAHVLQNIFVQQLQQAQHQSFVIAKCNI